MNNGNNVNNFVFHRYYIPNNEECTDEEQKEYYKCLIDCIFFISSENWDEYITQKFSDRYLRLLAKDSLKKFQSDKEKHEKKCEQLRNNANARWKQQQPKTDAEDTKKKLGW